MSRSTFDYSIYLPLPVGPVTPDWLGPKFLATLDALTRINPELFVGWQVGDLPRMKGIPLAAARPRIAEIIGRNVGRDDSGRAEPDYGYSAVALTSSDSETRQMSFEATSYGTISYGNLELRAGDIMVSPDPAIVTYPVFRAALLAINEIWRLPWGCAQAFRVHYDKGPLFPGADLFPYSRFHIPWIAYLGPSLLPGLVPPPDIKGERTPDGGLLMSATEERLDPTNPEHLRRARMLVDVLIKQTRYSADYGRPSRNA
jgi:Immunity protein 52